MSDTISDYIKKRQEVIAEKLQWWNEKKFRASYELEWSVGMLGSYIELSCLEGRPIEKINYSFPPKHLEMQSAHKVIFEEGDVKTQTELNKMTNATNIYDLDRKQTGSTDESTASTRSIDTQSSDGSLSDKV